MHRPHRSRLPDESSRLAVRAATGTAEPTTSARLVNRSDVHSSAAPPAASCHRPANRSSAARDGISTRRPPGVPADHRQHRQLGRRAGPAEPDRQGSRSPMSELAARSCPYLLGYWVMPDWAELDPERLERVAQLLVREACGATSVDGQSGDPRPGPAPRRPRRADHLRGQVVHEAPERQPASGRGQRFAAMGAQPERARPSASTRWGF